MPNMLVHEQADEVVRQTELKRNYQTVINALDRAQLAANQMSRGKPYSIIKTKLENYRNMVWQDINDTATRFICGQAEKLQRDAEWYQSDTNRRVGESVQRAFEWLVEQIVSLPGEAAADYQLYVELLTEDIDTAETFEDWLAAFSKIQDLRAEIAEEFGLSLGSGSIHLAEVEPLTVLETISQGEPACPAAD